MTGYRNKGCEALTKAIINEITKLQESAKFKIFTEDLDYDAFWASESKNVLFRIPPSERSTLLVG